VIAIGPGAPAGGHSLREPGGIYVVTGALEEDLHVLADRGRRVSTSTVHWALQLHAAPIG